ncbi:ComEA family DNA-binding protein [Streptomyces sp. HNM0575]|nr:ComEA family DNA-binding protein [Streptomyces sp. HNM0575]NLU71522.1 ComEA family DNA-binding protein [Streptomyces sp. HNM0575]
MPRAAAVASARAAVRRGRERRAAARETYAAWEAHTVREARTVPEGVPVYEGPGTDRAAAPPAGYGDGERAGGCARESGPLARSERTRLALWERLPLWVQLRCGIEPRTLLALAVVLVVAVGFAVHHFWTGRPETVRAPAVESAAEGSGGEPAAAGRTPGAGHAAAQLPGKRLVVDVGGKVRKPGVYKLANGARVADALRAAGGVRPGTDLSGLNRARRIVDGEQIVAGGPAGAGAASGSGARPGAKGGGGAGPDDGAAAAGAAGAPPGGPVSLSSATAAQLETLPGVGPVLAQHIVEYREEHGGFTSVDQLKEVDGIGDGRFADIEPKVGP